jgi:hypothetical protein
LDITCASHAGGHEFDPRPEYFVLGFEELANPAPIHHQSCTTVAPIHLSRTYPHLREPAHEPTPEPSPPLSRNQTGTKPVWHLYQNSTGTQKVWYRYHKTSTKRAPNRHQTGPSHQPSGRWHHRPEGVGLPLCLGQSTSATASAIPAKPQ